MSFPRYPEYKDSGAEWLGQVPAQWQTMRLKQLIAEVDERAGQGDYELLGLSKSRGVVGRTELEQGASESDNYAKYKVANVGQLVMNKMQAWNGVFGLSPRLGMVSPDYAVFRFIKSEYDTYLSTLFRTDLMAGIFYTRCKGMGTAFLRLNTPDFLDIKVPLPPVDDTKRIITFLDCETAKIDALVAAQEKLIALLKEKRQAVITHAVTKGLDPDVPMKDSGIEWLGEVPAHWGCAPMKYLVRLQSGGTPSKERLDYWDGDIPWASAKDMKVDRLFDTEDHVTEAAIEDGAAMYVPSGAVVVVVRGMILARTFPVALTMRDMTINQDLKAVMCGAGLRQEFLAWYLRGTADESLRRLDEAGHGTKALRMEAWTSLEVALPPIEEQAAIADFIDDVTERLDRLIDGAGSAVVLLKERRSALIAAAVTGKIDVRGLAGAH